MQKKKAQTVSDTWTRFTNQLNDLRGSRSDKDITHTHISHHILQLLTGKKHTQLLFQWIMTFIHHLHPTAHIFK